MEGTTVSCRYTFTKAEFNRAMRVFWFQTPRGLLAILSFAIIVGGIAYSSISDALSAPIGSRDQMRIGMILLNLIPPVLFAVLMVCLVKFQTSWAFRRGIFFNQPVNYTLGERECQMHTPAIEMKLQWSALTKWKSGTTGFIVYLKGGRSFHWFPYSGFQSPEDVDWMRRLLSKNTGKPA